VVLPVHLLGAEKQFGKGQVMDGPHLLDPKVVA
jgi:hypothetical protein